MFAFNRDVKSRDEILFGSYEPELYVGGIRRFENLTPRQLDDLVLLRFLDPLERHNLCPCALDIWRFMEKYPGYVATGYAVSAMRDDYRVSLDGLQKDGYDTENELDEFYRRFREADNFGVGTKKMYCWFD